jgi:hypothetical protein
MAIIGARRARPEFQFGISSLEFLAFEWRCAGLQSQVQPDGGTGLFARVDLRQQAEPGDSLGLQRGASLVVEDAERNAARAGIADGRRVTNAPFGQALDEATFGERRRGRFEINPEAVGFGRGDLPGSGRVAAVGQRLSGPRRELVVRKRTHGDAAAIRPDGNRAGLARELQLGRVHARGDGQRGFFRREPLRPREEREIDQHQHE